MRCGFWRDPQRYIETYWSRFRTCGSTAIGRRWTDDGLWYISGAQTIRSKRGANASGRAEVRLRARRALGGERGGGHRACRTKSKASSGLFLCAQARGSANGSARRMRGALLANSETHVAAGSEFVRDLPKTLNAKIMRRIIRAAIWERNPGMSRR